MNAERTPNKRSKYLTLAILVVWVVGVFVYTIFKFSGGRQ